MRRYLFSLLVVVPAFAALLFYLSSTATQANHQPNSEIFMGVDMCPRDQLDSVNVVQVDCLDNNAFSAATNTAGTGTMVLRTIEPCLDLASWPQDSDTLEDLPVEVHLYIKNVSDLIGAQVRVNIDETKVSVVSGSVVAPFTGRSFLNGPRDAFDAVPAARALSGVTGVTGAGTAAASHLLFASYLGTQGAGISPDTPDIAPGVDDGTLSAPGYPLRGFESAGGTGTGYSGATGAGGIWLAFKLLRDPSFTNGVAGINLAASTTTTPVASKIDRHNRFGSPTTTIDIPESQLFDGEIAIGTGVCSGLSLPPAPSAPAADTDLPKAATGAITPVNCTPATAGTFAHLWDCTVTNTSGGAIRGATLAFGRTCPVGCGVAPDITTTTAVAPLNQVHTGAPTIAGAHWEVNDWYVDQPSHCDESLADDNRLHLNFASDLTAGATFNVRVETCYLVHTTSLRITGAGFTTERFVPPAATPTPTVGGTPTATATVTATPATPGAAAAPDTGGEPGSEENIWPWIYAVAGAVLISATVATLVWRLRRRQS